MFYHLVIRYGCSCYNTGRVQHIFKRDVYKRQEYKSAGTGSIYGLPTTVGDHSTKDSYLDSTERNALKLKWDVYEEIGAPEIKDAGDIIDVMEKMVEAHPTDEDGNPFYGTILNNGSDTNYFACIQQYDSCLLYTSRCV